MDVTHLKANNDVNIKSLFANSGPNSIAPGHFAYTYIMTTLNILFFLLLASNILILNLVRVDEFFICRHAKKFIYGL
jgi:hypothetical protein